MGGSTDVDSAFAWMCNKAGGGDWLVLRTSGLFGLSIFYKRYGYTY